MNVLFKGALFNAVAAEEQRRRARLRGEKEYPDDCRISDNDWSRAARAMHKYDPDGSKLAALFEKDD